MNQTVKTEYKYSELTGRIIGCAIEVHKFLGNGFQEVIYQRALAHEMELQGLSFSREFEMSVYYKRYRLVHAGLTFWLKVKSVLKSRL